MHVLLVVKALLVAAFVVASVSSAPAQTDFKVCESTYALCTTAKCKPVVGQKGALACDCEVRTGYSAGLEPCTQIEDTDQGKKVNSRYFPVTSYAVCSNDRPWAWCLDKPCIIDPVDPNRASCACTTTEDQGPYVIVTDTYSDTTCTSGIISSATVEQIDQVTEFLKTSRDLKPFPITVLNDGR